MLAPMPFSQSCTEHCFCMEWIHTCVSLNSYSCVLFIFAKNFYENHMYVKLLLLPNVSPVEMHKTYQCTQGSSVAHISGPPNSWSWSGTQGCWRSPPLSLWEEAGLGGCRSAQGCRRRPRWGLWAACGCVNRTFLQSGTWTGAHNHSTWNNNDHQMHL